jgi:hypothetical protein
MLPNAGIPKVSTSVTSVSVITNSYRLKPRTLYPYRMTNLLVWLAQLRVCGPEKLLTNSGDMASKRQK